MTILTNTTYRGALDKIATATLMVALGALVLLAPASATADDSRTLWMASGEVGVGPIDEDIFLHLTPRLTFLRPTPLLLCDDGPGQDCESFLEASFQIPLRLRIADREPEQGEILRREDWSDVSDFFRIIRRIEYGSADDPLHLRAGELGSANLGHATIVNGYYNVITTDHYRLGIQGRADQPEWGAELLVNDISHPNLVGIRGQARPSQLYDPDSDRRRVAVGASVVADFNAPTRLATIGDEPAIAGPDHLPVVEDELATLIYGADVEWEAIRKDDWSLTPYADLNHHSRVGSGLHTGLLWSHDFGDSLRLSSRLEYRLLLDRYVPDYIGPLYEITRYQHPAYDEPGLAGPKLTAAVSFDSATRHGGFGQVQARFADLFTLSAAFSDATGPTGADLRLRASIDYEDRARFGAFYYQFVPGEQRLSTTLADLVDLDGSLVVAESRIAIIGPVYAHGQLARQWQLRDNGRFENVHLWNAGLGAGATF